MDLDAYLMMPILDDDVDQEETIEIPVNIINALAGHISAVKAQLDKIGMISSEERTAANIIRTNLRSAAEFLSRYTEA